MGSAGAALILPSLVAAADPSVAPAASASASGAPSASADTDSGKGMGGTKEAVTDASVVAKAIGISEADLNTALSGG